MSVHIFTGPTLSPQQARAELEAVYLPPAAQGDLYRAALERPLAIGIIDGYFERVPSVSHKEILWAMSQGIHVFGSASMGALRAAELAAFGMVGVGAVFEAFHRGDLEDDDEVAVIHASAEGGYSPLSEALVNIRATLRAAEHANVIDEQRRATLESVAKSMFYADRSWPALLLRAAEAGLAPAETEALRAFVRERRVDQKRDDAMAMLRAIREHLATDPGPRRVRYCFQPTDAWEFIRESALQRQPR